jgi:hypothetical protein
MRMRFWAVSVVALLCVGCLGQERVMVTEADPTPDIRHESDGMVTRFYDSDNPYTKEVIDRLIGDPRLRAELDRFGAMGYALSRENSFVTEGDTEDGRHTEMTVLSLGGASADERDAIYVFYVGGKRVEILPIELRLEEPEDPVHFTVAGDGVWLAPIEPIEATMGTREDPAYNWNWRRWAKCVGGQILTGAVACSFGCRVAPIVYMKCLAICGGIRTFAGVLECSIQEL